MKDTTPDITCVCGATAHKNFSAQIGANTRAEYFENNFFDLVPSQRGNNTFHISSCDINKQPKLKSPRRMNQQGTGER